MTSLEATLPQLTAGISFDAKSEFGRSTEGTEDASGAATDTGMAALLGMWATIFQQQVLPEPVAVEVGTAWQEGGKTAVAETQAASATGATEESPRGAKGAPALAADILGLIGGQAVQASIVWQPVPESVEAKVVSSEANPLQMMQEAVTPASLLPLPAKTEAPAVETSVVEPTGPDLPAPVAAPAPLKTEASTEAPVIAAVMEALVPIPPVAVPQKPKSSDAALKAVESENEIPIRHEPAPAASKVLPAQEPPPLETVVNLKRKVSERILPKAMAVDVQVAVKESPEPSSGPEPTLEVTPQAVPAEMTAQDVAAEASLNEAHLTEALPKEEPKMALEQPVQDAAPRQEAPVLKAAAEESAPSPAPHSLEPAPRAPSGATPPPAPQSTPVTQRSKPAFVPEAPPTPLASREAKTISIRIPLNDASAAMGTPARHLDLIFNQRNNDLTLQFNSPNTEIQGRIEESMPALLNKLQTENWTARPAELAASAAQPDMGFDGRRRADSLLPSANQFDSLREPIATAGTSSQGFNFDDSPADRKDAQDQNQQGRNRKKEQAWQNEFDEQLEP